MTVSFSAEDLAFLDSLIANKVKSISSGKEITQIGTTDKIASGDLLLVRKTQSNEDKAVNYDNLLKSIGNTAIDGFVATTVADDDNAVKLTSANLVKVDKYYNGMKVSFVSPIENKGQFMVQVDSLALKPLYAYKTSDTAVIGIDDYIEAVYIESGDAFYQVNKNNLVYTNEYVCDLYDIPENGIYTNLYLESALGAKKDKYYKGMTINFICPTDTKGFVRVNIDGLGVKDILEGDVDDLIYTPLWDGQHVQATFDGEAFKHNSYQKSDPKLEPSITDFTTQTEIQEITITENVKIEAPVIIKVVEPVQKNFEYMVGSSNGCKFTNLEQAIDACIKEFGTNGSGKTVTLKIMDTIRITQPISNEKRFYIFMLHKLDLSWITIAGNNKIINIDFTYKTTHIVNGLFGFNQATINFDDNLIWNIVSNSSSDASRIIGFHISGNSKITFNNHTFNTSKNLEGFVTVADGGKLIMNGTKLLYKDENGGVSKEKMVRIFSIIKADIELNDCDFTCSSGSNVNSHLLWIAYSGKAIIKNTKCTNATTDVIQTTTILGKDNSGNAYIELNNCDIVSQNNFYGIAFFYGGVLIKQQNSKCKVAKTKGQRGGTGDMTFSATPITATSSGSETYYDNSIAYYEYTLIGSQT
jgi:hypothetical protein